MMIYFINTYSANAYFFDLLRKWNLVDDEQNNLPTLSRDGVWPKSSIGRN